jgi:hypothetical protein
MENDIDNIVMEDSIYIDRSTEDIWNFLTELSNEKLWIRIVNDTHLTSDTLGLGATGFRVAKRRGKMYWKVTEWEEQRVLGFDYIGGIFNGTRVIIRIEPEGTGNRVVLRAEAPAPRNFINRIFLIIMKPIVARNWAANLKSLKSIMEG